MKRILTVATIALAQVGLVAVAVHPQLSARLTGDTYVMRVEALDPIDPFRGAYVALDYPDLRQQLDRERVRQFDNDERGDIYITLQLGDGVWVGKDRTRERPDKGPYLACDDRSWQIRCGIESFFLPQDEAASAEELLRAGAVAEVHIDGRGNAAVVDVRQP